MSVTDRGTPPAVAACNAMYLSLVHRYGECDGRSTEFGLAFEVLGLVQGSLLADLQYECSRIGADVATGKIGFDDSKLASCQADTEALTCNTLYSPVVNFPDSCSALFVGTVHDSGTCELSQECVGSGTCEDATECPGTCTPDFTAMMVCANGTVCSNEQTCDQVSGACVARHTSGPCDGSQDCAGGYQCTNGGGDASYLCVAYKRIGDACTVGTNECSPGTFCSAGSCAAWPGLGGQCGNLAGETVGCLDGACSAAAAKEDGGDPSRKCVARVPLGSPCEQPPGELDTCAAGATCVAGACAVLRCF